MKFFSSHKAKNIEVVVFDSLGVFISEYEFLSKSQAEPTIRRSHVDGQGISYFRAAGVRVGIFADKEGFVERLVSKFNLLPSSVSGTWQQVEILSGDDKLATITEWLKLHNVSMNHCAAMGDDIGDLPYLRKVGFSGAPAQAEELVRKNVDFVSSRRGGDGAVRDFANAILSAKNTNLEALPKK